MPWGPEYMLGIGEIDDQHAKLVALINKQHKFMKLQKSNGKSGEILKELTDYTEYHFKYEETLFETYVYHEKVAHLKSHEKLVDQVNNFKMQRKEGSASLNMDIMIFLTD